MECLMSSDLYNKCSYYLASHDISIFTEEQRSKLKVFVQTDQSGAEALIVAYLCKNADFRKLFIHGVKPHVYVAIQVFAEVWNKRMRNQISSDFKFDINTFINSPIESIKTLPFFKELDSLIKDSDNWPVNERYYYLAKQTCHSANYGITTNPFRMNVLEKSGGKIMLPQEEADRFLLTYHSLFPEIRDWHRRLREQVERTHIVYNLHGHPLTITWHEVEEAKWKEIYALPPQSTVGMITNMAFSKLQQHTESNNLRWDHMINCHDSVLSQCPIGEETELGKKHKEYIEMQFTSPVDGAVFNMRSETQFGFNWGVYKKGKDGKEDVNKLGLRELKF